MILFDHRVKPLDPSSDDFHLTGWVRESLEDQAIHLLGVHYRHLSTGAMWRAQRISGGEIVEADRDWLFDVHRILHQVG